MLPILFQSLAVALLGVLAPGSILLVIFLLMTDRGLRNGASFAIGYVTSYFFIGVGGLLLGRHLPRPERPPRPDEPSATVAFVLIAIGVGLIVFVVRTWRTPPSPTVQDARQSRFAGFMDRITPIRSFGVAAVFSVANVKNFSFFLSATYVLLVAEVPFAPKVVMLVPVTIVFSAVVIIPVLIYLWFPDRASTYLGQIRDMVNTYSRPITIGLTLLVAVFLMYRGLNILF